MALLRSTVLWISVLVISCSVLLQLRLSGVPFRNIVPNGFVFAPNSRDDQFHLGSADDHKETETIKVHTAALELRPPGDPNQASFLNNLALALKDRYDRFGSDTDLEEMVKLYAAALKLLPPGHSDRDVSLNNLATALNRRYARFGSEFDLEEIVKLRRYILELRPPGHPDRDVSLNRLAGALGTRYDRFGSEVDLNELTKLRTAELELRPPGHPGRADSLNNLAGAVNRRYAQFRLEADLEKMVQLLTAALGLRPPGHPYRDVSLNSLAGTLTIRYDRFGQDDDLEDIVKLYAATLELRPPGHPYRDVSLSNLADTFKTRYDRFGMEADLEEMVKLYVATLELRPPGHPYRDISLSNIAEAFSRRYDRFHSIDDLEETIKLHTIALELRSSGHSDRGVSFLSLALALHRRYARFELETDLEEMVKLYTAALNLHPPGHPYWSPSLHGLAYALSHRYEQSGSMDDLEEMIKLYATALELQPPGHSDRGDLMNSLALALSRRYERSGSMDDLEETIKLHTAALELRPPGHSDRGVSIYGLAIALSRRYDRSGLMDDLEETIKLHTAALALRPPGHPDRSVSFNGLAIALRNRYEQFGSEDDLEEMIKLYRDALTLQPPGHSARVSSLNGLAIALSNRYDRFRAEDDLEEVVKLYRATLDLLPPGHSDQGVTLNNLASAIGNRYAHSGSEADLEEMAELFTRIMVVLELHQPNHPLRSVLLGNLANTLMKQYVRFGCVATLEDIVILYEDALSGMRPGHPDQASLLKNLAVTFTLQYEQLRLDPKYALEHPSRLLGNARELMKNAIKLCPFGHPRHASHTHAYVSILWHTRDSPVTIEEVFRILKEVSKDDISPLGDTLHCMRLWVEFAREVNHPTLVDAYDHAIQFLSRYLTIGPTIKRQHDALSREAAILSLPMDAAAHAIENGKPEKAVELLDAGRSLLWSEMRRYREPSVELDLVDEHLANKFRSVCAQLQNVSTLEVSYDFTFEDGGTGQMKVNVDSPINTSYEQLLSRKRQLRQEHEQLLGLIRAQPGMELFQQSLPFSKLQAAAIEGPIVIVNTSRYGSHIIIVFADRPPSVIALDDNNFDFHIKALSIHEDYVDAVNSMEREMDEKLKTVMRQLWTLVVSRVVDKLTMVGIQKETRIWWCPTSVLTLLPLHAAGSGKHFLIDSYISSYTPTLKALIDARQSSPTTVATGKYPKLLVVAQSKSADLPAAASELDIMCKLGPFVDSLDEEEATRTSVLKELPSYQWTHFIGHGSLESSPFNSSLHLYKEDRLTLNDIIRAHIPDAKFAFLAACHSAEQVRSKSVLQDEVLHLGAAMQFCGFRSVVGTMWEMEDADGPEVARRFYEQMLEGEDDAGQRHTLAARALWNVTRRMKDKLSESRWANFVHIGV